MTIEKIHSGIRIYTMHNGYLVSRLFIGYTKKEAISEFKEYLKGR
jgi:hypothetical protein